MQREQLMRTADFLAGLDDHPPALTHPQEFHLVAKSILNSLPEVDEIKPKEVFSMKGIGILSRLAVLCLATVDDVIDWTEDDDEPEDA